MPDIKVTISDHVMVITLARAQKKNAITDAMYGELVDAFSRAAIDQDVHVALINADGPDFCAGNDIAMFVDTVASGSDITQSNTAPFLAALSTFPKPLIAAVTRPRDRYWRHYAAALRPDLCRRRRHAQISVHRSGSGA